LPAGRLALNQQHAQPIGTRVNGGRKIGWPAANDDDVIKRLLGARAKADLRGYLGRRRPNEERAIGKRGRSSLENLYARHLGHALIDDD
jgi:hypothetical protein